ncbi:tripartite tricarboxylate transporter TctB family protein [Pseudonocardia humida]|uniref:Tripartite tricarboxylate transporter TctB family protein n=1 Tax=Pseudonocardia humida TaxID=2800819 RepID=A0ABT0ZSS4_9PSEU|nr:tripartite tricarboxylate transporter TctB family protein [Pseudonocardia humida]MCO1653786.1 tripartite tricarboxylate transporter TctB family protein [Pseudonocardia humida]
MVIRSRRASRAVQPAGGPGGDRPADPPVPEPTAVAAAAEEVPDEPSAPPAGYLANALAAVVPLVIGAGGLALSLAMGLGSVTAPGPGLWPAIVCAGLVAMSVVLLVGGRRFHDAEALTSGTLPVLLAVATLLALVLAMPYVGFELPTVLVAFVWLKVLGREGWLLSTVVAVVLTAVLWLLFVQLFDVPLPHLI